MSDTTYRTKITPAAASTDVQAKVSTDVTQTPTSVEPPFSEYENKNGKPYAVDYFDLGRYWNTGELYTKEIGSITEYMSHLVNTGEISNSIESVKNKLKSIEKMINVKSDDRKATRVGLVAAHVEFLLKADRIKKDSAKYGMI